MLKRIKQWCWLPMMCVFLQINAQNNKSVCYDGLGMEAMCCEPGQYFNMDEEGNYSCVQCNSDNGLFVYVDNNGNYYCLRKCAYDIGDGTYLCCGEREVISLNQNSKLSCYSFEDYDRYIKKQEDKDEAESIWEWLTS